MDKLTLVKIGGNIIDNSDELTKFLDNFASLDGAKLLVHGGGVMASNMLRGLGIEPRMIDGRRITDEETLRIVTMVYAGWINKNIVSKLQSKGCDALGLSGADGNTILATKRPASPIDYGYVGDLTTQGVNTSLLQKLLNDGLVPVSCAITHDGNGNLLNTNADTVAAALATALSSIYHVKLVYCFEKKGVLADPDDDSSVLPSLNYTEYEKMKVDGTAKAGMIPKLDNSFGVMRNGVQEVVIKHAVDLLVEDAGTFLKL